MFETKPFESNIDIYYETSSCGLVKDLNEHCDFASNGPSNIQVTPTFQVSSFTPASRKQESVRFETTWIVGVRECLKERQQRKNPKLG